MIRSIGARRARSVRPRAEAAEADRRRQADSRARRLRLLAGERDGDDIVLWTPQRAGRPRKVLARFPMLRQQEVIADDKPNRSLADFVAPIEAASPITSARSRSPPASAWTRSSRSSRRPTTTTPRSSSRRSPIDWPRRLRNTCTRRRARLGLWRQLSNDDLIDEKYRGIRPAFGYPACPDHSEKGRLFDLLGARVDRPGPDRVVRDDAGGVGERPVFRPSAIEIFCDSARRRRTRSRTMRSARA